MLLCDFFRVPSNSMAPAVISGDFILVEKWTYGARILTSYKFERYQDPRVIRMFGIGNIHRGDVVVFNYPYRENNDNICMNLNMRLIKRCVGIAGDSLSIVNGCYHISELTDTVCYVSKKISPLNYRQESSYKDIFPYDTTFHWNVTDFGPLLIPAAGLSISLTSRNFILFRKLIAYETAAKVCMKDSLVYINDSLVQSYTFRENWYFMAGDHTANSHDSRYFGLIPEKYIIGKAFIILSSKETYTGRKRWERMMRMITFISGNHDIYTLHTG
jgi:signal peptidase I